MLTVRIAGWGLMVSFRSCSGPLKQMRLRAKLLGVLIRDLHPVFLFEGHDQLDEVEGIGLQVLGKRGVRGYLLDVDAKLLRDDAPELVEIRFGHPTLLLVWSPGAGSRPNLVYTIANRSVPQRIPGRARRDLSQLVTIGYGPICCPTSVA